MTWVYLPGIFLFKLILVARSLRQRNLGLTVVEKRETKATSRWPKKPDFSAGTAVSCDVGQVGFCSIVMCMLPGEHSSMRRKLTMSISKAPPQPTPRWRRRCQHVATKRPRVNTASERAKLPLIDIAHLFIYYSPSRQCLPFVGYWSLVCTSILFRTVYPTLLDVTARVWCCNFLTCLLNCFGIYT